MTQHTTTLLSRWLPTLVAVAACGSNVAYTARWAGQLETRLAAVEQHTLSPIEHMPLTQKLSLFPTRSEFDAQIKLRDGTFAEFRALLLDHAKHRDAMFADLRASIVEQGRKIDAIYLSLPRRPGND